MIGQIPAPEGKSIQQWQHEVTEFLRELKEEIEQPKPIHLSYLLGGESATESGVLMYDAAAGKVVFSDGTAFKQLQVVP